MDKAYKPLNIFISYGHEIDVRDNSGKLLYPEPNNESVVRKIKAYLESRGHKVWLDTEEIKPGDDWRRKIYEGVTGSNVALICLSHKAMKPNGVCRDEIAIAVGVRGGYPFSITLEKLEIAEYPAYLLNPQLFTEFEDWNLYWTEDSIDEATLDQKLKNLATTLETKDFQLYEVEMEELKKLLKPWKMDSRLRSLDRDEQFLYNEKTGNWEKQTVHKFCGRESLFNLFEEKILQGGKAIRVDSERVLWLKKGPGFGKSRFAAELRYRYCCPICASYFIEYDQKESLKPQTFIKSIAFQLAQTNSTYRKKLLDYLTNNLGTINLQTGDPQTLFKSLIIDLMVDEIDGGRPTQWILVDALDEATENNHNPIATLIRNNLKNLRSWICFFITSRDKDPVVNRQFAQFTPVIFSEVENVKDVRNYICSEFESMNLTVSEGGISKEELITLLHEKSEGTFLYPEMFFSDLKNKTIELDSVPALPTGVIGYIQSQFERLFGDNMDLFENDVRPMLGLILTSCEPIPRAVLKYCLGISDNSKLDKHLKPLGTFFEQSGFTDEDAIKPFHKSVIDYCFDPEKSQEFYVYPENANRTFAQLGWDLYKSGVLQWTNKADKKPDTIQQYFLNWLPSHLMNANKTEEAAAVLSDFAFLMKRLRFGNVEQVLKDYILFRGALNRISPDCDAFFDVICSNAHFLRRNSEDNPAYKIMLQIATEVADNCPVTQAAERWLNPEMGDSPCAWLWLNKNWRSKEYCPNPCKLVMENSGDNTLILSNGDALSWGSNYTLSLFDLKTGVCKTVLEEHTDYVNGAMQLHSGEILSWSEDGALRLWSLDGTCTKVLKGHTGPVNGAIELRTGDILSWGEDQSLRLWTAEGIDKKVLEGHTGPVSGAIELRSGEILSWSEDQTLRLWTAEGIETTVFEEHTDKINGAMQLRSGDVLSWSSDKTLRIWSIDGTCKKVMVGEVLEGFPDEVNGAIELRSGDILSWGTFIDYNMYLWTSDGDRKAVLKGHTDEINGAMQLHSGDILSWSSDKTLRLWSSDGTFKKVLEGHSDDVKSAIELRSGDIISWSLLYLSDQKDFALHLWSPDGTSKAVLKGHTNYIEGVTELDSGDILSWGNDYTLRLWSPSVSCNTVQKDYTVYINDVIKLSSGDILSWFGKALQIRGADGTCKVVMEGHTKDVNGALELDSGDILSWSADKTLRLWSLDGACKKVLDGHKKYVIGAIQLSSGDILSWSDDRTLRVWSLDGTCKAVMEGHKKDVNGAIQLSSGDILSWCLSYLSEDNKDYTLRLWSLDGSCKAVMEGHTNYIRDVRELRSGDILSWCTDSSINEKNDKKDYSLRIWSPDGTCKAVLDGHTNRVLGAIELRSGDILSWVGYSFDSNSNDFYSRLWAPDGTCKAILNDHENRAMSVIELGSGDFISWNGNHSEDPTIHLWHPDGSCKEIINPDNPVYGSYISLFIPEYVNKQFYLKELSYGIELQHDFKPTARWDCHQNFPYSHALYAGDGNIYVLHEEKLYVLQLNFGNRMNITFEQAHQELLRDKLNN